MAQSHLLLVMLELSHGCCCCLPEWSFVLRGVSKSTTWDWDLGRKAVPQGPDQFHA